MNWKSITEIPTEHYEKNLCISPEYIVLCEGTCGFSNLPIIGRSFYSFVTNRWYPCFEHIGIPNTTPKIIGWADCID